MFRCEKWVLSFMCRKGDLIFRGTPTRRCNRHSSFFVQDDAAAEFEAAVAVGGAGSSPRLCAEHGKSTMCRRCNDATASADHSSIVHNLRHNTPSGHC